MSTEFVPISQSSGAIDFTSMKQQQQQNWQQPHTFFFASKPSAIDVFVHHMGVVINARTGELTQMQAVVHVDTFILPLSSVTPAVGSSHPPLQSVTLTGVILQTQSFLYC
ncbi:unnamed protein product [Gongylonema pulchrum]|uniref:Uncharacterized protein n=1 Tax=Gongylonema pulchrum TaxID=637853 RepID=A0A183D8S4_9BILA|nr:unnamed protein product [Gongylonema pulchrum]